MVATGVWYGISRSNKSQEVESIAENTQPPAPTPTPEPQPAATPVTPQPAPSPVTSVQKYTGVILDDQSKTKVIEFNQHDYDLAISTGKIITLYFYSKENCDVCQAELEQMMVGFSELNDESIVGFRVHYADSLTSAASTSLATKFGVSESHTKVILKNGVAAVKATEWWNEEKFEDEVKALKK